MVADHDLAHERDLSHYRARHVGMVFQLHNLLPTLTALENVQMPMFELGHPPLRARAPARHLLELVGMAEREREPPDAALRRRAPAGRDRSRARQRARRDPGRRADRQPRLDVGAAGDGASRVGLP